MSTDKKPYHHGDLRANLLEITAKIIAEEGEGKVTMRTLSQQAGVSQAAPYRHFTDKAELLCSVAAEGFKKLENRLQEVVNQHPENDALSCLEDMAVAYVYFAVSNPAYYRLMFGSQALLRSPTAELRRNAQAAFAILQEVIHRGQQNDSLIREEPLSLTNILWATVHGLSILLIDQQIQNGETARGTRPLPANENTFTADDTQKLVKLAVRTIIDGIKTG